jgi:hypothetical protein
MTNMPSISERRYPTLELWQRNGRDLPVSHPIYLAACYEAAARDLEDQADRATTALGWRTWQTAAMAERFKAMHELRTAPQGPPPSLRAVAA